MCRRKGTAVKGCFRNSGRESGAERIRDSIVPRIRVGSRRARSAVYLISICVRLVWQLSSPTLPVDGSIGIRPVLTQFRVHCGLITSRVPIGILYRGLIEPIRTRLPVRSVYEFRPRVELQGKISSGHRGDRNIHCVVGLVRVRLLTVVVDGTYVVYDRVFCDTTVHLDRVHILVYGPRTEVREGCRRTLSDLAIGLESVFLPNTINGSALDSVYSGIFTLHGVFDVISLRHFGSVDRVGSEGQRAKNISTDLIHYFIGWLVRI